MDSAPPTKGKAAFEKLPIEVRHGVMSFLPDVNMRSMALSCRSFYDALKSGEPLITKRVLFKTIEDGVLLEAIAVLESSRLRSRTGRTISKFVAQHVELRGIPTPTWNLSNALPISKIHSHVHHFAADFCSRSQETWPIDFGSTEISRVEVTRFERAFYRFELYCSLFRHAGKPICSFDEQKRIYFDKFPPWENEQLTCIHDYLFRAMSSDNVVYCNLHSSEAEIPSIQRPRDIEPILARGLSSIHSIIMAQTYEDRRNFLYPNYLLHSADFLYEALKASNDAYNPDVDDYLHLWDYTEEDKRLRIRSSFFDDDDYGLVGAWYWAHHREMWSRFVNSDSQRSLRECGYVFWNNARPDDVAMFQMEWMEPGQPENDIDDDERRRRRASQDRRISTRPVAEAGGVPKTRARSFGHRVVDSKAIV
ncbi:uncharacterized protein PAC_05734 [Phialocephala subalpina]|uniref:F-box domain-containing protein n=1 Tax=Phialocephala subalpina TaxID=576137 RepID=A0A1L7WSW4_9HELO|nr:uncharacterized protein PAC_05734 [Phialocephala subalpina]